MSILTGLPATAWRPIDHTQYESKSDSAENYTPAAAPSYGGSDWTKNFLPYDSGEDDDWEEWDDYKADNPRGYVTTASMTVPGNKVSGYSNSSSSTGAMKPTKLGQVSYSEMVAPIGPKPEYGELPDFSMPEWDERAVRRKAQSKAAPGVMKLRRQVQRALAAPEENPNVKAYKMREALSGYGLGLQGVMTGADSAAQSEYARERAELYNEKQLEYQANVNKIQSEYNAAWKDYSQQYTSKTTTHDIYGQDELEDITGVDVGLPEYNTSSTSSSFSTTYGSSLSLNNLQNFLWT